MSQDYSDTGERNTGSNVGAGAQVLKDKSGVDLRHRSLVGEDGIEVTQTADEITIGGPTSAPTPGTPILRDVDGRAEVEDPTTAKEIANKGYIESLAEWNFNKFGPRTQRPFTQTGTSLRRICAMGMSSDGQTVVVASVENANLACYKSVDGGANFTKTTTPSVTAFSTTNMGGPLQIQVYVLSSSVFSISFVTAHNSANGCHFSKTTNGGVSWTDNAGGVGGVSGANVCQLTTQIIDESTAWFAAALTNTGGVRWALTTNSGSSFTNGVVSATNSNNATGPALIRAADSTTAYVFWGAAANALTWSKTTNAGTNWTASATIVSTYDAGGEANGNIINGYAVTSTNVLVSFVTNATTEKTYQTTDGSTWNLILDSATDTNGVLEASSMHAAIFGVLSDGTLVMLQEHKASASVEDSLDRKMRFSTDNGTTWSETRHFIIPFIYATVTTNSNAMGYGPTFVSPSLGRIFLLVGPTNPSGSGVQTEQLTFADFVKEINVVT